MKYFTTKYALTSGIEEVDGELLELDSSVTYVKVKSSYSLFKLGVNIFELEDDARKSANQMIDKKIKSLEKQLLKYKKLNFKMTEGAKQ